MLKSSFSGESVQVQDVVASGRQGSKSDASQVRAAVFDFGSSTKTLKKAEKENITTYTGAARISKKRGSLGNLAMLDLIDFPAAIADKAAELLGRKIEIQLISEDLDPQTNAGKLSAKSTIQGWLTSNGDVDLVADEDFYSITFKVPRDFGTPAAIVIRNNHPNEFFLKSLAIQGPDKRTIDFPANAWIHKHEHYAKDRVFFYNKVFLPCHTPPGLIEYRERELEQIRGDGTGERKPWDRIYDFDVYNDLGNPDKDKALARPVLGSSEFPYPRRMRTGRKMTKLDPKSESRLTSAGDIPYIPSDEFFVRSKNSTFIAGAIKGAVHSILPAISDALDGASPDFQSRQQIKDLYKKGLTVDVSHTGLTPEAGAEKGNMVLLSSIFSPKGQNTSVINYPLPQILQCDEKAWETDEEFGRQTLAGLHPSVIERVKVYPPKSALDPAEYGEGTALTDKHILPYLKEKTVAEAIEAKKLFIVDYHDALMPFVKLTNASPLGYKSYAPRAIFYANEGLIKPVAIELSLPPTEKGGPASNRVFTPADEADCLWGLAKIHFNVIDSNYHQVLSHYTFCHGVMETVIIPSHRQLSELHPIKTLLKPLFKDTLSINAAARGSLINGGGVIESYFAMGTYAFQLGSKGYGALWRFDHQALPQNLISRGMAEPDASKPGSVKLVFEDYPWAKDGLEIWEAIRSWMARYVDIAYKGSDEAVKKDTELQAWWHEIVNRGHEDLKNAPWWPKLDSIESLVHILTTVSWIAGPNHASLNFGQWTYSGFPLNKPSLARRFVPEKGSKEYKELQKNVSKFVFSTIPSNKQTTQILTVLELLSTHAVDEEYIGTRNEPNWISDPEVLAAFREFGNKIAAIEVNIKVRNKDQALINRRGPVHVPYTLLFPSSTSGITGQGVPNSVSI